ncbi:MAG: hypothetical protein K0R51_76 [Cytophagaceae bacterium]|jgi:hypothetical protein|nr:hypothetical protein [Cytophagaceae bacterium]
MSNTLKFSRLSLLLKNHLVEHKQKYLFYLAGMFFIGLIVMLLALSFTSYYPDNNTYTANREPRTTGWEAAQTVMYLGGLAIFGVIFASVSFVNFNNKGEAIFFLIKPASQLEKWLSEIIVHVFLFFLAYTFIYYLIDIPLTMIVRYNEYEVFMEAYKDWTPVEQRANLFHASSYFHFSSMKDDFLIVYPICISVYLSLTAFFLYGAVLFNRFSFFKTLILGFVTFIAYLIYSSWGLRNFEHFILPDDWNTLSFVKAYSRGEGYSFKTALGDHWTAIMAYFVMFIIPAFLLACSYFKLKEKEV